MIRCAGVFGVVMIVGTGCNFDASGLQMPGDAGGLFDSALPDATQPDSAGDAQSNPVCGNGIVESGEVCDDGDNNSDSAPDACRTDCMPAHCGDGVVDLGETCDDGDNNSDSTPDACRIDCRAPYCGDGVTDLDEQCDDNNQIEGDGCSSTCVSFPAAMNPNGWACFEEDLASCEIIPQGDCSTSDSINTCEPHETGDYVTAPDAIHIHTGSTGYCGYGGVGQQVDVPFATPVYLHFWTKASCDSYASRAGVALDDGTNRTWLLLYNREEGDWTETFSDVTPWAGQSVTIEVFVQDMSEDWCNMSDHSYRVRADDFYFTQDDS